MAEKIPVQQNSNELAEKAHLFYAIVFGVLAIASLAALVMYHSLTDSTDQNASIGNVAPSLTVFTGIATDPIYLLDSLTITLAENTTTNIFLHGTATDANGCNQIKKAAGGGTWSAKVYRTGAPIGDVGAGASCATANNADCYTIATQPTTTDEATNCSSVSSTGTTVGYEYVVPIQYYADPTDAGTYATDTWTSRVDLADSSNAAATPATDTFEIASTAALSVDTSIDFSSSNSSHPGAMHLGDTSDTDTTMTVVNTGNTTIDTSLSGTSTDNPGYFTCTTGKMLITNSHYSTSTLQSWDTSLPLTTTPALVPAFSITKKVQGGGAASLPIYWRLNIPSTGVSGTCSSTTTVTASIH